MYPLSICHSWHIHCHLSQAKYTYTIAWLIEPLSGSMDNKLLLHWKHTTTLWILTPGNLALCEYLFLIFSTGWQHCYYCWFELHSPATLYHTYWANSLWTTCWLTIRNDCCYFQLPIVGKIIVVWLCIVIIHCIAVGLAYGGFTCGYCIAGT